jgi:putative flippase GtrA
MIDRTLIRFLIVGIGNTTLGLGVIFGARQIVSDIVANLIGYLVVVPISFLSHRDLSFKDRGSRRAAFVRYIPTICAGYAANFAMLSTCLKSGANPYIAQTLAIGCHVAVTYILSRVFVFLTPAESQQ